MSSFPCVMGGHGLVRTSLYDEHVSLNANIVDFHGFELPIWYSNIKDEHLATRDNAGLFDVSHMGTFSFRGCLLYTSPSPRDQRGSRMPGCA